MSEAVALKLLYVYTGHCTSQSLCLSVNISKLFLSGYACQCRQTSLKHEKLYILFQLLKKPWFSGLSLLLLTLLSFALSLIEILISFPVWCLRKLISQLGIGIQGEGGGGGVWWCGCVWFGCGGGGDGKRETNKNKN